VFCQLFHVAFVFSPRCGFLVLDEVSKTERQDIPNCRKGIEREVFLTEAKRNKRASETQDILASQAEEQINVLRETRVAMICDGVVADNHVLNPVLN